MIGYVGGDASKGYADFCVVGPGGKSLAKFKADDNWEGHQALHSLLAHLVRDGKASSFVVGLESSGGVERNWLHSLRKAGPAVSQVVHLNPLLVKNHRERKLHRTITDASSAHTIAEVLRTFDSMSQSVPPEQEEARRLSRHVDGLVDQAARLRGELQGVLVNTHPELVQFCRGNIPAWILSLLQQFPTNAHLAEAQVEDLLAIRYFKPVRASAVIEGAKRSVCSSVGPLTATLVLSLVRQIKLLDDEIAVLKQPLDAALPADGVTELLLSIPGIGAATARGLRLVYGDFSSFRSEQAVVAFAGLDPRIHQSGDSEKHSGISRRGHASVRRLLYFAAVTAVRRDLRFKGFYNRLVGRGKPPMVGIVAVMVKLLRIAYACVLKGVAYDKNYVVEAPREVQSKIAEGPPSSLAAPISRQEARRRKKAAAAAQCEVKPQ